MNTCAVDNVSGMRSKTDTGRETIILNTDMKEVSFVYSKVFFCIIDIVTPLNLSRFLVPRNVLISYFTVI
jgi:hypothetical protein